MKVELNHYFVTKYIKLNDSDPFMLWETFKCKLSELLNKYIPSKMTYQAKI